MFDPIAAIEGMRHELNMYGYCCPDRKDLESLRDTIVTLCDTIRRTQRYLHKGADTDLIIADLATGLAIADAEKVIKHPCVDQTECAKCGLCDD